MPCMIERPRLRRSVPESMSSTAQRVAVIIAALEEDPGQLVGELASRVGLETRHLSRLLWRMGSRGFVLHEEHRTDPRSTPGLPATHL